MSFPSSSAYSSGGGEAGGEGGGSVPIREVVLDGLALLKIVKHCTDISPGEATGSILGLDKDGILHITYAYPFPNASEKDFDGNEYQIEMMKNLREVNVENYCVGWYKSVFFGSMYTDSVLDLQLAYQNTENLTENNVVLMYDPNLSKQGNLVIKAFRLSERYIMLRQNKLNDFIKPSEIFQELPIRIQNVGHASAFIRCLQDTHKGELDCDFEPLSLANTDTVTERHLKMMWEWLEDLVVEQLSFQDFSKKVAKPRQEQIRWLKKRMEDNAVARDKEEKEMSVRLEDSHGYRPLPEAPFRGTALRNIGQISRYCEQVSEHIDSSFLGLVVSSSLSGDGK